MILGTAGHIDHGKTALVRALTGVDTDRLPEERRRGITIQLGFAPLRLEGLEPIGVVDVPGHEGFVRTMLAGASGVDLALLVIAADEGVMPQTREHLAILTLLGVRAGIVALTKCDLADATLRAMVRDEVHDLLAGSALASATIVEVSAATGEGMVALRGAIAEVARTVPRRTAEEVWRLPVDRVFSVPGAGTVVTGTAWSGALAREAAVRLLPSDRVARVRGLESHGAPSARVEAGRRVAVALAGVDRDEVPPDAVLVRVDEPWETSRLLRADVALLDGAPTVGPRRRLRFHLGTADVGARLVAVGGPVGPGSARAVRLVLDAPVVARAGDRFVLRDGARTGTIGGGVITDPMPPRRRAKPFPHPGATELERARWMLDEAGASGLARADLPQRLGVRAGQVDRLLKEVGRLTAIGERVVANAVLDRARAKLVEAVDRTHAERPLAPGIDRQTARRLLAGTDALADEVIRRAERAGVIVVEGATIRRPGFAAGSGAEARSARDRVAERLRAAGVEPPSLTELKAEFGGEVVPLLKLLEREGVVVAIGLEWWFAREAVIELLARLRAAVRPGERQAPAELRDRLGLTRKWLIPFLEWCDRRGFSRRVEDGRIFREVPAEP